MKIKMSRKMGKNEKNDYYFWRKFLSHKMSEYKFWVVKNGELHLFRNPHENFEPDSSEMEWGVLKNINFHDDEKTTWNEGEEEEEDKEEDEEEEEKKEESETKNIKENRKVVVAHYFCQGIFKIPDGLDLNETVVKDWTVRRDTLYIHYVDGREDKIESHVDTEPDWKYPDCKIEDAEDYNVEYSEDEEEEEDCVHNFYLCKFCCSEYDETEVDCKHCGRNRCVFTYQAKNKSEAIAMTKE